MKRGIILFLLLAILAPTALMAGRQEGILKQFRATEEALKAREKSTEARRETLEANLMRGLREAVLRMFYEEQDTWLADLKPENFFYENPTSPKVYYVRYKNLIIRFDFATDPEMYYQAPVLRKVLVVDENMAHQNDQPANNQPAANQPGANPGP